MFTNRLTMICLTVLLATTVSLSSQAQEGDGPSRVAILVVDAFEPICDPVPIVAGIDDRPVDLDALGLDDECPEQVISEETCAVAPTGLDGSAIQGADDVKFLTSALYPQAPHGVLVYTELRHHLQTVYEAVPVDATDGTTEFDKMWIRDIEIWQIEEMGEVVLIAVDTDAYETRAIQNRIAWTVDALQSGTGFGLLEGIPIDNIVVNMSFAYIPCDQVPANRLSTFQDAAQILMELDLGREGENYDLDFEDLLGLPEDTEPAELVQFFRSEERGTQYELVLSAVTYVQTTPHIQQALINAYQVFYQGYSIDCSEMECDMANFSEIAELLPQDIQDLRAGIDEITEDSDSVVFVAAAGNDPYNVPYMPASWPNVVSTSADYAALTTCPEAPVEVQMEDLMAWADDPEQTLIDLQNPQSNAGEIMMNGVSAIHVDKIFGCLRGTSFAAPRLSLEEAIYLLRGGESTCSVSGGVNYPPLGHDTWDNARRDCPAGGDCVDADQYCPQFDTKVTILVQ